MDFMTTAPKRFLFKCGLYKSTDTKSLDNTSYNNK